MAVNLSPVPREGDSQEWVMLELEPGSSSGATKPPAGTPCQDKEDCPGVRSSEPQNQGSPTCPYTDISVHGETCQCPWQNVQLMVKLLNMYFGCP